MFNLRRSLSSLFRSASRFGRDSTGASAVAFTLAAPIVLICIAGVTSYMYALQYKSDVQSATDTAAIASTEALNANASTNVSPLAYAYFRVNAPPTAPTNGLFYVNPANYNNTITTQMEYNGTVPSLISSTALGSPSLPVDALSQAQVMYAAKSGAGSSGGGSGSGNGSGGGVWFRLRLRLNLWPCLAPCASAAAAASMATRMCNRPLWTFTSPARRPSGAGTM